ncbi:YfaP family protein [Mesonia sp. K7]|uniref:YfaP family protein n=1 Tax=Mesonia sp. K7 TaxID=2218606 RepID=UPI000DA92BB4|nr:hypothetical protein [Mesonia sp. K7]PZD77244.1 hypothetical protein DNG35_09230 [Mesonia sp. K7]
MKRNYLLITAFLLSITMTTTSCSNDDEDNNDDGGGSLVGQPGNPRFNLQFTNEENVDLDLHVETPNGIEVYYANANADGGELDVDCYCSSCSQGPNENIYWEDGTAPTGTYKYWVEYYGDCNGNSASSSFTLRVVKNNQIIATRTGSLSSGMSDVWTHEQQ